MKLMRKETLVAAIFLAGCATPEVQIVHQTVPNNIAVGKPCVDGKDIPAKPKSQMRRDGDTRQLAAGATIDIRNLDEYSDKLDAMLRACAKP